MMTQLCGTSQSVQLYAIQIRKLGCERIIRKSISLIAHPGVTRVNNMEGGISEVCRGKERDHKVEGKHEDVAMLN
jgi:hypothetical protein